MRGPFRIDSVRRGHNKKIRPAKCRGLQADSIALQPDQDEFDMRSQAASSIRVGKTRFNASIRWVGVVTK